MLYPAPSILATISNFSGKRENLPTMALGLSQEQFTEFMEKFQRNYPDTFSSEKFYPRPQFTFPLLNSPDGNPIFYFSTAIKHLQECKFIQEAAELQHLMFSDYKEHPAIIANYLDIGQTLTYEDYKEISDFNKKRGFAQPISPITFKSTEEKLEQIPEFTNLDMAKVKKLIANNFDFTTENIFGRNILWYSDTPELTNFIIQNTDADVFHIDHCGKNLFHKCFLHQDLECSYGTLITIIDNMQMLDPEVTEDFLSDVEILPIICTSLKEQLTTLLKTESDSDFIADKNKEIAKFDIVFDIAPLLKKFEPNLLAEFVNFFGDEQQKFLSLPNKEINKIKFLTSNYAFLLDLHIPKPESKSVSSVKKF